MSKLSENLKYYRGLKHETQQEISDTCHITRSAYGMYEQGSRVPGFDTLCVLASHFGVNVNQLLGNDASHDTVIQAVLTDEEKALVMAYRNADPTYRTVAMELLQSHKA